MTTSVEDLRDLVGTRTRVFDGAGRTVRAEGEVVAVLDEHPTLVIRTAAGEVSHESALLPRQVLVGRAVPRQRTDAERSGAS